jgi:lysozyme
METPKKIAAALALSLGGLALISNFEGKSNRVYLDLGGVPTVCAGHTGDLGELPVGTFLSDSVCYELLLRDTRQSGRYVHRFVTVPITQSQFDALVSLVFNIGPTAFKSSTLLRKLNAGDCVGAAKQFLRWDKVRGKIIRGLSKRRAAEATLFSRGCFRASAATSGVLRAVEPS